jgi:hypothetical protein
MRCASMMPLAKYMHERHWMCGLPEEDPGLVLAPGRAFVWLLFTSLEEAAPTCAGRAAFPDTSAE